MVWRCSLSVEEYVAAGKEVVAPRLDCPTCERPMRGLRSHRSARILAAGHAFVQNVRRGHYDIATDVHDHHKLRKVFDDLALTTSPQSCAVPKLAHRL